MPRRLLIIVLLAAIGQGCDPSSQNTPQPPGGEDGDVSTNASGVTPDLTLTDELEEIFAVIRSGPAPGAARVRLKKHDKVNGESGQSAFLFGLSYHVEKRYGEAMPHYEKALELAPEYVTTHYFKGWGHYYLGDLEAARASFDTHLTYDPDAWDTHFGLGLVELDENELVAALARFERTLELQPDGTTGADRSKVHTRLADVHLAANQLDDARDQLDEAIAHMPQNGEAAYKRYRLLLRLGEDGAAAQAQAEYEAITGSALPTEPATGDRP